MQFESWVDAQIREATERGEFDNLPGAGKPITGIRRTDPDWWIKDKMRREGIERPASEAELLRAEVAELDTILADARTEDEAREIITDLNARIRTARLRRGSLPTRVVELVDVDDTLRRWQTRNR
ncbi:hypothetical protein GGQ54_001245 [Naumannella cuiyingiana]|uniref:DnaJ homologue subfamily C member 28 conserved domain-containing protein n=1 Tax=Naumannella cuiyingiana TaxID=1347891 RepID=A0A7Z0IKK6_9ACTN|nr:DUF1992 domain-containing protein [Naumannella cuiyingiana]NYI70685.1 hypothetical protein [Naumannella cuiyingiana]